MTKNFFLKTKVLNTKMSWEEFYLNHLPPADFEDNRVLLKEFCERQHNKIVLVTSGGTSVPLGMYLKMSIPKGFTLRKASVCDGKCGNKIK